MRKNRIGGNQLKTVRIRRSGITGHKDPIDYFEKNGKRISDRINYLGFRFITKERTITYWKKRIFVTIDWDKLEERKNNFY